MEGGAGRPRGQKGLQGRPDPKLAALGHLELEPIWQPEQDAASISPSSMVSRNSSAASAAMAALSLLWAFNTLASDPDTGAAVDAVTRKDGMLRSAVDSYERSEKQLREKFGKELAALNEARLKAFQQAFDRASSRRDTESVATLAGIINTIKSEGTEESLGAKPAEASLIGDWEFVYNGQARRFRFAKNNSFQGEYAVSGKAFSGTWEGSKSGIVLKRPGEKEDVFATISISDIGEARLRQFNGYEMSGQKSE